MCANIQTVRDGADAVGHVELALSSLLNELTFAAEYGHGSTSRAIDLLQESRKHADRAVVAAAVGNAIMAAKHEVQAAVAQDEAVQTLGRAAGHADDLQKGLVTATEDVGSAMGSATSLVKLDDSSPAAEIHVKVAAQPDELDAMLQQVKEIQLHVPSSRDPAELRTAAEHFGALQDELEEASGRAQAIAADSREYSSSI